MSVIDWLVERGVFVRNERTCYRCLRPRPEHAVIPVIVEDAPLGQAPGEMKTRPICLSCIGLHTRDVEGRRVPSNLLRLDGRPFAERVLSQ